MTFAQFVSTFGGVGYLRPAPGTWGSLATVPFTWAIYQLGGLVSVIAVLILVIALGTWATLEATRGTDDHDPSEIVIDEVAGQMIALLAGIIPAWSMGLPLLTLWPAWVAGFVLFRVFDIWKPGPVGWADRRGDAWGVMLDDLIAGGFAAVGVVILAGISHGVLGM